MLSLSLVSGLWIAVMVLILPRVLAHPHAVQPLPLKRANRPRHRGVK